MRIKRDINCYAMPVSLERFKKHLRMNESVFDEDLEHKLRAAFMTAENYISRYLMPSTFTITGHGDAVELPSSLNSLESVTSPDGEKLEYKEDDGKVIFAEEVDYVIVCNAGNCEEEDILQAVLLIASSMFTNPTDTVEQFPKASQNLLKPYRQWRRLI